MDIFLVKSSIIALHLQLLMTDKKSRIRIINPLAVCIGSTENCDSDIKIKEPLKNVKASKNS